MPFEDAVRTSPTFSKAFNPLNGLSAGWILRPMRKLRSQWAPDEKCVCPQAPRTPITAIIRPA